MKMHKIMFLAVAAMLFVMPPVKAQDEDSSDSGGETESAGDKPGESGESTDGGSAGGDGKGNPGGAAEKAEKKTIFTKHHQQIKTLRDKKTKLENAGRSREARKLLDALKTEQKKLKALFEKEAEKIKTEIVHVKEQIRKSRASLREKLEAELKQHEERLKMLESDADLGNWCAELTEAPADKDKPSDPKSSESKPKTRKKKIHKKKKK